MNLAPVVWLYLACGVGLGAVGGLFSKKFADNPSWKYALLAWLLYGVANTFWLLLIRGTQKLSTASMLWCVSANILSILMGTLIFGETLSTQQKIGLVFAIVAVWLIAS